MKFLLVETADSNAKDSIDFSSLEGLIEWIDKLPHKRIVIERSYLGKEWIIEIYNDWRE